MEPLQTWWATELYPSKDEDTFGVAGDFEVVRATDAQAAIAALQDERDGWVRSREHYYQLWMRATDERDEMRKERDEFESLLTQRTAELEAVSNFIGVQYDAESRTWVSGQAPYQSAGTTKQEACIAAVDALRLACATWETKYRDLQAELERVRGELADERTAYKALSEQYNRLDLEHSDLRTLLLALPKVEGEITVKQRGDEFVVMVGTLIWLKCYKTDEILINAIVALWQHRQGMEG